MAGDSKTEKATPKKRRDERKKGNVLMSKDIIAVATLFGSIFILRTMFSGMAEKLANFLHYCFSLANDVPAGGVQASLAVLTRQSVVTLAKTAGPMLGITVLLAMTATFAQTRLLVTAESMKPKFNRISPLQGFKRLFSLKSVMEAFKGILKISILMYIIYTSLIGMVGSLVNYLHADLSGALTHLFGQIFSMMIKIGIAFTALAALDFLYQWWDYERQLKMSKQEIKEEYKQTEGNPQIKGRIKEIQRKMAQARMMQQVPQADVIIKNPTHFAVALRYKPDQDNAPIVLAKGQDELALRIVRTAEEHTITVVENIPLARSLYAGAEIGQEIPAELYGAVAEVMVYLYKLDRAAE